jgi:NADH:ubiquinone oxidoreductase subunit B-like Fe-S oxidoreductase
VISCDAVSGWVVLWKGRCVTRMAAAVALRIDDRRGTPRYVASRGGSASSYCRYHTWPRYARDVTP